MSGVLAVLDAEIAKAGRANAHGERYAALCTARITAADLIAERNRLANLVSSHEAQILRMTSERSELITALAEAVSFIGALPGHLSPPPGHYRSWRAALARFNGETP